MLSTAKDRLETKMTRDKSDLSEPLVENQNLTLLSFRVDCSGRRVASLDVDGVVKVNLYHFLNRLHEHRRKKNTTNARSTN